MTYTFSPPGDVMPHNANVLLSRLSDYVLQMLKSAVGFDNMQINVFFCGLLLSLWRIKARYHTTR